MDQSKIFVSDSALEQITLVYGNDVHRILDAKKLEGCQIIFTDDFGVPHPILPSCEN